WANTVRYEPAALACIHRSPAHRPVPGRAEGNSQRPADCLRVCQPPSTPASCPDGGSLAVGRLRGRDFGSALATCHSRSCPIPDARRWWILTACSAAQALFAGEPTPTPAPYCPRAKAPPSAPTVDGGRSMLRQGGRRASLARRWAAGLGGSDRS